MRYFKGEGTAVRITKLHEGHRKKEITVLPRGNLSNHLSNHRTKSNRKKRRRGKERKKKKENSKIFKRELENNINRSKNSMFKK